jgi:peroxidase
MRKRIKNGTTRLFDLWVAGVRSIKVQPRKKLTSMLHGPEALEPRAMMTASSPISIVPLQPEPINGVGNNVANPTWGAADTDFVRLAAANFADGISSPNGQSLPSARAISNLIANQDIAGVEQDLNNNRNMTDFVYAWGQFIDHDIDLTESGSVPMNIPVPGGDATFDPTNLGDLLIAFDRSQIAPGTGASTSNPAQYINDITSYIDGSMIYGSDAVTAAALRTFSGGLLKTSAGNLLPYNTMGLDMADNLGAPEDTLFAAGDVRANENIELSNLTTLFVREHNYQATLLAKQHPTWTDEQLYQAARQIVIGEIQSITYNEWLPALMGNNALTPYRGYNPNVNASVSVEFSSAAFRLHTLLDDDVDFLDNNGNPVTSIEGGSMPLDEDFFQPEIVAIPGEVAANLKYLASDLAQDVDEQTVDGLRNALFPDAPILDNVEVGASDLIADDIQRGRDEGDPTYNQMRVQLGERPVTSFAQITSNKQLQSELQQIYGNVNNVELFVGLMAENHLPGSSLGQTEQAIIAQQFQSLRDGDRYFYMNADSPALVNQLNHTTLAQIIERNTTLTNLQSDVFLFHASISGTVTNGQFQIGPSPFGFGGMGGFGGPGGGYGGGGFGGGQNNQGIAGLTVNLIDSDGDTLATTTTDAHGNYSFNVTETGNFQVQLVTPNSAKSSILSRTVDITRGDIFINGLNFVLSLPSQGGGHGWNSWAAFDDTGDNWS